MGSTACVEGLSPDHLGLRAASGLPSIPLCRPGSASMTQTWRLSPHASAADLYGSRRPARGSSSPFPSAPPDTPFPICVCTAPGCPDQHQIVLRGLQVTRAGSDDRRPPSRPCRPRERSLASPPKSSTASSDYPGVIAERIAPLAARFGLSPGDGVALARPAPHHRRAPQPRDDRRRGAHPVSEPKYASPQALRQAIKGPAGCACLSAPPGASERSSAAIRLRPATRTRLHSRPQPLGAQGGCRQCSRDSPPQRVTAKMSTSTAGAAAISPTPSAPCARRRVSISATTSSLNSGPPGR